VLTVTETYGSLTAPICFLRTGISTLARVCVPNVTLNGVSMTHKHHLGVLTMYSNPIYAH
jgi:hypothetical protein